MSTGQILTVVGYAVGTYFGYPQLGAVVGGLVGSAIDASNVHYDVPKVGDLKAPQMQYGARLPRLYGSNRTSGSVAWYSAKRVVPGDGGGGKGGTPSGPTPDTADIDVLYILAIDSPIVGITRVWKNGEMVWTPSTTSDHWGDIRFLDGNPDQLPDPTIEATDGVGNVPAYRHRQCVLIESLHLGQSGQLPLIEFECVGNAALVPGNTKIFANFNDGTPRDLVSGAIDDVFDRTEYLVDGGELVCGYHSGADANWGWAYIAPSIYGGPVSVECFATWGETPPSVTDGSSFIMRYFPSTNPDAPDGLHGVTFDLYYGPYGSVGFRTNWNSDALTIFDVRRIDTSSAVTGRTHFAMVFASTAMRVYINGAKFFELAGDFTFAADPGWPGQLVCGAPASPGFGAGWDWSYNTAGTRYTIDEIALRHEESYIADNFPVPAHIPGIDWVVSSDSATSAQLDAVITAEWTRVADHRQIDVTDLAGITVRGFQTAGSVRGAFEALAPIFHFGAVCSDKLYFRKQGGASVATIPFDDLAAGENQAAAEPFVPERANSDEIPQRTALTYPNYSDDYANGTETGDRGSGDATATSAISSNIVMTPAEAKAAAEVLAAQSSVGATTAAISVTDYYAELEPTDRIMVPDEDGTLYEMRITRETYAAGIKQLDLVRDGVSTLQAVGATGYTGTRVVDAPLPKETEIVLLDTAIVRDADDDAGFYAVAKGSTHGSVLYTSPDNVTYVSAVTFSAQSVFGSCTTVLNNWTGGRVFDETSRVTVSIGLGTLASSTRAALLSDQTINACAIGIDGRWELCQFRTATLVSAGVYTLSGFLRGSRGTEWASTGHGSDESFVLIGSAMRRFVVDAGNVGLSEYYKGVTVGRALSTATEQTFVDNAIGKKPFAPVHLRALGDPTAALVTWQRRTRLSTRLASSLGMLCPLGEAGEAYDLELRDGGGGLLLSTSVTTNSWTGDVSSAATITVFQRSATAGRGYPVTLSL